MKVASLFLLLLLSLYSKAQNNSKHEIGLGIGFIDLNPNYLDHRSYFDPRYTNNNIIQQNTYRHKMIGVNELITSKGYTFPVIYYTNKISEKSSLRMSFQFAYQRGKAINPFPLEHSEPGTFKFQQKQYNINFGYSYHFFNKKYLSLYAAFDFETVYTNVQESETTEKFYDDFYYSIDEEVMLSRTNINFNLIQSIGFKIPIYHSLNIKYEFSGWLKEFELRFRPINRLSLNYIF